MKAGAMSLRARFALETDVSLVLLDDAFADPEAEACAHVAFGREEGFKQVGANLLGDS
ncbi:MAG: hypothetical protein NVSMB3_10730 [Acidobacteriaceae bacterium]